MFGIEGMQKTYTGFFSGAESTTLPQRVEDRQQEFETAFTQMSHLATQLAEYQQQISKAMAEAKPPAEAPTWANVVGNTAASGAPAGTG